MYTTLLTAHSWFRWVVLIAAIVAVVRAWSGLRRPWTAADDMAGRLFTISADLQFLMGIALYAFLSPITQLAFDDFGAAMRDSQARFWAVEHITGMLISLVLAHIGRARARRIGESARKHKIAAVFFTLSLIVMLLSIPWPGMPAGRELFRGI